MPVVSRKVCELNDSIDCEGKKHLENVIRNILGLFSSANASFISENVEKIIQYHLFVEEIKKEKKKEGKNKAINIHNKTCCNT